MTSLPAYPVITIDFGNTRLKASLVKASGEIISESGSHDAIMAEVEKWVKEYDVKRSAVSGSGTIPPEIPERLHRMGIAKVLEITPHTPVPITMEYPRETLGADRLEAAVAAAEQGKVKLIADAGTALTLDVVDGTNYLGGSISPGLNMRFDALHINCALLPKVDERELPPLIGGNTREAISAGAGRGFLYEITSQYHALREIYPSLEMVVTGGDAEYVCRWLDSKGVPYCHDPHLVARGMAEILDYNTTVITDYE